MKKIKKILILLLIIEIGAGGWLYYKKYTEEKQRRIAEEEKRKQEELEREKQRRLLEEKKKEFETLVKEIEELYKKGNYAKVKELAEKAFSLAKQYNFNTDRIKEILHLIEVNVALSKLKKLEKENEDIFKYFYVRKHLAQIPSFKEIIPLKNKILKKTYENEYQVNLILAKKSIEEAKIAEDPKCNYLWSRKLYEEAKNIRKKFGFEKDLKEGEIEKLQNNLFFALKLHKDTIPISLY